MKGLATNGLILGFALFVASATAASADEAATAQNILDATGVRGGLVVHLGCGDGQLTAALGACDRYLVHGLDSDAADVEKARLAIASKGLYGRVSVEQAAGPRLPYADGLVKLAVVDDKSLAPMSEVMRVLAPGGAACVREGDAWKKTVKPVPDDIDEWTHFLYDATNNAVSQDEEVGPPRQMQWVAGPKFARGHENLGSLSVAVSSAGRLFYIADEGPIATVQLPSDWRLIARDAYSGVLLWKKKIPTWEYRLRPFRSGPPQLHRRLVADGEVVYATLGYGTPVTKLCGATGDVVHTYRGTEGTEEIIHADGVLYLVVGNAEDQRAVDRAVRRGSALPPVTRRIAAVDAQSGKTLWQTAEGKLPELFPMTLAVANGRTFYQTTEAIHALDAETGKELWKVDRPAALKRRGWAAPTLVVHDGVVLVADQKTAAGNEDRPQPVAWSVTLAGGGQDGEIIALSAETGKELWSGPCRQTYNAPPDVLVVDDLLWTGRLIQAREPGITRALEPTTGEIKFERPADQEYYNVGMGHHRCYRNKATCNYLVMGRSGVEFQELKSGEAEAHHWVRGTCQHGVVPCNGLLYATPHTCGCFIKAKLNGLNALAPAKDEGEGETGRAGEGETRLVHGPAYDRGQGAVTRDQGSADDWPTFRHDAARSGSTAAEAPAKVKPAWQADLGGRLSAVVVAEGKALVARVDAHTVHALDAETGERVWSFTAGGRVDSPPTVDRGRAYFGSADGWVYCIRMTDGELVWRFRAAPGIRRVVSYDRLESAWPVSGAVLVIDGSVYCVAGRSSFLDGGMRLVRIDADSGELISETEISSYDEKTGEQIEAAVRPRGTEMPGGLPDVLSSDGESLFMRHRAFDLEGVERQGPSKPHLFSSVGFLDDTWWHRTYWIWGTNFNSGWGGWWRAGNKVPAGRILVVDDELVYGFGRNFMPSGNAHQWRKGEFYRYFSAPKEFEPEKPAGGKKSRRRNPDRSIVPTRWSHKADLEARALVLAGGTLFAAGPLGETNRSLAAFRGEEGIRMRAMSAGDGSTLAEIELEALPVFDGMAVAGGKLFLATKDGKLTCFAGK